MRAVRDCPQCQGVEALLRVFDATLGGRVQEACLIPAPNGRLIELISKPGDSLVRIDQKLPWNKVLGAA